MVAIELRCHARHESGQQLLPPASAEEDLKDDLHLDETEQNSVDGDGDEVKSRQFLDAHLTGRTDASQFSESWRVKFSHHPSWCDADMCLQQINLGNATGNRVALYARSLFQRVLFHLGEVVQKWPKTVIMLGLMVLTLCCFGLQGVHIETDLVKLWVTQGGRLDEEMNFLQHVKSNHQAVSVADAARSKRETLQPVQAHVLHSPTPAPHHHHQQPGFEYDPEPEIPRDNGLNGGGFQVLIQTQEVPGSNILSKDGLLRHVDIMSEVAQYTVDAFGETWTLADICFRPPAPPPPAKVPFADVFTSMLDRIIPCIWITPADCFWEGSKPLGPFPPIHLDIPADLLRSLPKGNISWRNLDPEALLEEATSFLKGLEPMKNLFERAGIGHAYQRDRPCIDPLDAECPQGAPNYFDRCEALRKLEAWNSTLPKQDRIYLTPELKPKEESNEFDIVQLLGKKRKKRESQPGSPQSRNTTTASNAIRPQSSSKQQAKQSSDAGDADGDYYDDPGVDTSRASSKSSGGDSGEKEKCERYGKSLLEWMRRSPEKWSLFLKDDSSLPRYPNWGELMTGGCRGFGKRIMQWPEDLIIGGIEKSNGLIKKAEALQSVFLVASPSDVFRRFQRAGHANQTKLKAILKSVDEAGHIVASWQRRFTERVYAHPLNQRKGVERVFHPLAGTSIQDMLAQFSEFQWTVILIGYVLMIIYAGWSQVEWDGYWFSERSSCFIAILGVIVITYASVAGLGMSTMLGIHFNAATTQIVPFLTLGLGIDDMFLMLHNYNGVLESVKKRELAVLLKETGMAVLLTSINNILAFLTGTILPIPALRSFCAQVAILLFFNVICTIVIFPAIIAIDLRRRKEGIRDMTFGCCCRVSPAAKAERKLRLEQLQQKVMPGSDSRNHLVLKDQLQLQQSNPTATDTANSPPPETRPELELAAHCDFGEQHAWYTLTGFLHRYYIPLLRRPWAKVGVLAMCLCMFLFGCLGLYRHKLGLELADVLPESTPPAAFLRAREKYFSFYPFYVVLKGPNVDYPTQQQKIEELRMEISKSHFVIKGLDGVSPSEQYWMHHMKAWLVSLQEAFDKALAEKLVDPTTGAILAPKALEFEAALGRRLLCSYGKEYNCTRRMAVRLVEQDGTINAEGFYNYLTAWYHIDNMMYYVSQASFYPSPPHWAFNPDEEVLVPPASTLLYSQMPIYLTGLVDTPPIIEMIREIRAVCERFTDDGLPVFPAGIPFTFWEQYLHLTFYLFVAVVTIGVAVLLVISVIIFNPWAAAMVAIIVVSMTVELAGFMGLFGVKMNPISAVTLITAVGIGVEFTAHVVLAFLSSLGTRDERMASCLEHMFVPVIHGGLSTLLGIIMLAFSEFDFVIKYFFVVMTALIIIGLFNGLAMLPVMLSLIGPPCEIIPTDGGKTLPCPPSRKKPIRDGGSPISSGSSGSSSGGGRPLSAREHKMHESLSTLNEEGSQHISMHTPSPNPHGTSYGATNLSATKRND